MITEKVSDSDRKVSICVIKVSHGHGVKRVSDGVRKISEGVRMVFYVSR